MLLDGPDCPLWATIAGEGRPVTVLAHGLAASSSDIAGMATALPGTRVLFDFRGHGRSAAPPPEAGYDLPAMTRDLDWIVRRVGATCVVGVSMGASAVLSLLEADPDRFERIALVLPAAVDVAMPGAGWYAHLAERIVHEPLEQIAEDSIATEAVRLLAERCPAWTERLHALAMGMANPGLIHALAAVPASPPPVRDAASLRRVEAPVLIASHEGDPIHEASTARRLGSILPNATVEIAPQPLAMLDDMTDFSRRLASFLSSPAPVAG